MPGVKPRYTGPASGGRAGSDGVWLTPVAGKIATRRSSVRIERMTQYTGRKRERARRIPGPASVPIGVAQTLRTFCACKPFGPWATSNSTVSSHLRPLRCLGRILLDRQPDRHAEIAQRRVIALHALTQSDHRRVGRRRRAVLAGRRVLDQRVHLRDEPPRLQLNGILVHGGTHLGAPPAQEAA